MVGVIDKGLNMKELSAGDPELLRWVMGFIGFNLGQASCLLTIIKRYLDGDVSKEEFGQFAKAEKWMREG